MKVKQLPADFVVEERADLTATDEGRFSVYKLRKEGIGTLEALRALRRAWRVGPREVGSLGHYTDCSLQAYSNSLGLTYLT